MSESMSFDVSLSETHEDAIQRVTDALAAEGFGVLTRVDLHQAFKGKIGVAFRPYSILGACNPKLALQGDLEQARGGPAASVQRHGRASRWGCPRSNHQSRRDNNY